MYELHLETEGLDHTESLFQQFLNDYEFEICPSGGVISYEDGEVKCSIRDIKN
jgi:hypothetical protein